MNAPTGGYPNWIDPASGDHCYARTGSSRLGQSPPPVCLCGHDFHTGPCRTAMPDERRRPVSARKPARWLIRRSASAWRWQIIDTHATEWADYVRLETITGAEAVAAFARGGR